MRSFHLAILALLTPYGALADATLRLELLDPAQWPDMPPNRAVIDVFFQVDGEDEYWVDLGTFAGTEGGAEFVYARDPNTGRIGLTAPDFLDGGRFVTFLSQPREQAARSRFRAALEGVGGWIGGGNPTTLPTHLDIFSGRNRGAMDSSGYVERIAIDLSNTPYSIRDLYLSEDPISDDFMLADFLVGASASRSFTFGFWYLFAVPEPSTLLLLALGLFAIRKR